MSRRQRTRVQFPAPPLAPERSAFAEGASHSAPGVFGGRRHVRTVLRCCRWSALRTRPPVLAVFVSSCGVVTLRPEQIHLGPPTPRDGAGGSTFGGRGGNAELALRGNPTGDDPRAAVTDPDSCGWDRDTGPLRLPRKGSFLRAKRRCRVGAEDGAESDRYRVGEAGRGAYRSARGTGAKGDPAGGMPGCRRWQAGLWAW